jgi:hypothetical protein
MSGRPRHEALPELFAGLLAPFALSRRERWLGRLLVRLLAIPGTSVLLRAWHRSRGSK